MSTPSSLVCQVPCAGSSCVISVVFALLVSCWVLFPLELVSAVHIHKGNKPETLEHKPSGTRLVIFQPWMAGDQEAKAQRQHASQLCGWMWQQTGLKHKNSCIQPTLAHLSTRYSLISGWKEPHPPCSSWRSFVNCMGGWACAKAQIAIEQNLCVFPEVWSTPLRLCTSSYWQSSFLPVEICYLHPFW